MPLMKATVDGSICTSPNGTVGSPPSQRASAGPVSNAGGPRARGQDGPHSAPHQPAPRPAMNPRRIPVLLLTLLPLAAVRPLDSAWRFVETTDDLTGASDRRLILRADNWSATGA